MSKPETINADQTITDPKTGLEWSPTLGKRVDWKTAKKVAEACRAGAMMIGVFRPSRN